MTRPNAKATPQKTGGRGPAVWKWVWRIVPTAGTAVALFGLYEARESRLIADKALAAVNLQNDRAAGLTRAKLALHGYSPRDDQIRVNLVEVNKDGTAGVKLKNVDGLKSYNPRVFVKNVGDEPVDAIRVAAKVLVVGAKVNDEKAKSEMTALTSWWHDRTETVDYPLPRKLFKDEVASIPLFKPVLGQLMFIQLSQPQSGDHYGLFQFRYFGKLVGAQAYDPMPDGSETMMQFSWTPSTFTPDACKGHIASDTASIEITPAKPER